MTDAQTNLWKSEPKTACDVTHTSVLHNRSRMCSLLNLVTCKQQQQIPKVARQTASHYYIQVDIFQRGI